MVEFDQMWFIFNIVSHAVHIGVAALGLPWYIETYAPGAASGIETLILILEKVLKCR